MADTFQEKCSNMFKVVDLFYDEVLPPQSLSHGRGMDTYLTYNLDDLLDALERLGMDYAAASDALEMAYKADILLFDAENYEVSPSSNFEEMAELVRQWNRMNRTIFEFVGNLI